jgi:hypothetical protein
MAYWQDLALLAGTLLVGDRRRGESHKKCHWTFSTMAGNEDFMIHGQLNDVGVFFSNNFFSGV